MREAILSHLTQIESGEKVRIVYACESGSRAWGFPSIDSDYDVRFIYLHPREWYLSIDDKPDVIELPLKDGLDINGWDLKKALQLFRKSNPPLFEWLGSPIVYLERYSVAEQLRSLSKKYYSLRSCLFHYLHMAQGNCREFFQGETVWVKKYFYVLRPLLAIQWIEQGLGVVPTEFTVLVNRLVTDGELRSDIDKLLEAKRAGMELGRGPRIPSISRFIEQELNRWENHPWNDVPNRESDDDLNELFRASFNEVWQQA